MVAIWLSDKAIRAGPPWFTLRWNRPIARRRHQGWRRTQTSARVSRPCSGIFSGGTDQPGNERHSCAKQPSQVPLRESRHRHVPGGAFHPGATQTNAGAIIERRSCIGSVAFVISPPASTSRAGGRNVGEEIEPSATSTAALLRFSLADVAEQAEHTDARTSSFSCSCGYRCDALH